jgi:GNAT superfamily N-acetyltransferase
VPAPSLPIVRPWDPDGPDADAVGRLVGTYLRQTEREKAAHLRGESMSLDAKLPARYRPEAEDPRSAYAEATVELAEIDGVIVGVLVLVPGEDGTQIKRLWTLPDARGQGVGSALIDAAIAHGAGPLRLTVWDWRADALRLYAARGFVRVASWDERPRMVCMERIG